MDIQVFSDLHFEAQAEFDIPKTEAEIIILAGDIGEGLDGVHWALRQANLLEKPVLYVFGNHEHYQHSFPGLITEAKLLTQGTRVHVLERNRHIHGQTRFLGCTLWTDFQLFGADNFSACKQLARGLMPDYQSIVKPNQEPLQPEDTLWLFDQSSKWLQRELDQPWPGKTVVVTHHAPTSLCNDPKHAEDMMSSAFISNLDHVIKYHNIDAWIHGHTHYNVDFHLRKTRIISHQRGYPGETVPGNPFSKSLVFVL